MTWTERVVAATRWHGDPDDTGWEQVERALDMWLPSDFKELCRRFGPDADRAGQVAGQRGQDRPVWPGQSWSAVDLTA